MCGRITQTREARAYAKKVGWSEVDYRDRDWHPDWNMPPGRNPFVLHLLGGKPAIDSVHWGYHPKWAVERKLPMMINARLEKAATGAACLSLGG